MASPQPAPEPGFARREAHYEKNRLALITGGRHGCASECHARNETRGLTGEPGVPPCY